MDMVESSRMFTGKVYIYKKKHKVLITGGQYESGGRVSNFWFFNFINKDGTLGKEGGDYNNEVDKFERVDDNSYEIKIVFKE